jgi:hypothetical protein
VSGGAPSSGTRVVAGTLHRVRRGRGKGFSAEAPAGPSRRPARVAVTLALAHQIQRAIDRGEIRDQAEAARRLGLTRARLTQILDLTRLTPDVQEEILFLDVIDGREPLSERVLRGMVGASAWADQRAVERASALRQPLKANRAAGSGTQRSRRRAREKGSVSARYDSDLGSCRDLGRSIPLQGVTERSRGRGVRSSCIVPCIRKSERGGCRCSCLASTPRHRCNPDTFPSLSSPTAHRDWRSLRE